MKLITITCDCSGCDKSMIRSPFVNETDFETEVKNYQHNGWLVTRSHQYKNGEGPLIYRYFCSEDHLRKWKKDNL